MLNAQAIDKSTQKRKNEENKQQINQLKCLYLFVKLCQCLRTVYEREHSNLFNDFSWPNKRFFGCLFWNLNLVFGEIMCNAIIRVQFTEQQTYASATLIATAIPSPIWCSTKSISHFISVFDSIKLP